MPFIHLPARCITPIPNHNHATPPQLLHPRPPFTRPSPFALRPHPRPTGQRTERPSKDPRRPRPVSLGVAMLCFGVQEERRRRRGTRKTPPPPSHLPNWCQPTWRLAPGCDVGGGEGWLCCGQHKHVQMSGSGRGFMWLSLGGRDSGILRVSSGFCRSLPIGHSPGRRGGGGRAFYPVRVTPFLSLKLCHQHPRPEGVG